MEDFELLLEVLSLPTLLKTDLPEMPGDFLKAPSSSG